MSTAVTSSSSSLITEEHKKQYRQEGFFVLERAIDPAMLELLRGECEHFITKRNAEMDAAGAHELGSDIRDNRYFIANRYRESEGAKLSRFIFGDLMAEICRATIGPEAFLFYEQWVVKGAEKGVTFSWHQDSGYVKAPHKPYVTCWSTLDDVNEENGTVFLLPYSRAGTRERIEHVRIGRDMVGYHGDDPGDAVIVPAGSVAVFSSVCFHRSGANRSPRMRRVYLTQYAAEPIINLEGKLSGLADPFLKDGVRVST
jgi:ectoine hydroxylase-related dioxygenase (phytanoyl-CoA dioxygenase family)